MAREGRNREVSPVNVQYVLALHKRTLDEHAKLIHEVKLLAQRTDKNLRNRIKKEKRDG